MTEVKQLKLIFPYGATSEQCEKIAKMSQDIVGYSVSEGGYEPKIDPYFGWKPDYHKDKMVYTFEYKKCPKSI